MSIMIVNNRGSTKASWHRWNRDRTRNEARENIIHRIMELQGGYNFPSETLFHLNTYPSSYLMYVSTGQARKIKG